MRNATSEPEALAGYFATLLASVSVQAAKMIASGGDVKGLDKNMGVGTRRGSATARPSEQPETGGADDLWPADPVDTVVPFQQSTRDDGNLHKRYADGRTRVENPNSGIIQEERPDGSLIVSLPNGKMLYQEYPSDPLLAYDLNNPQAPPVPAGVGLIQLPGAPDQVPVYHFRDAQGTHLVGLDSLRYFRVKQPAGRAGR